MNGPGTKRKHLDEKTWRDILTRFDASGMGVTAFCRREGVGVSSLRLWRDRLIPPLTPTPKPTTTTRPALQDAARVTPPAPSAPKFIELGTLGQASVGSGRLEIKLDLGGGLSLHLVRG